MKAINNRIKDLSELFLQQIIKLKHNNGLALIKLYGSKNAEARGGTFLINFFDYKGQLFPFQYVEEKANAENISLRTGCFCNPGIDETNHCLSGKQLQSYYAGREHGDYFDMIRFLGRLRGAVRVSIGFPTSTGDIYRFISFAKKFLNNTVPIERLSSLKIKNISGHPVPLY